MTHLTSAFKNLCIKVPVDPISKMPKSSYERTGKCLTQQCSIDSSSTCSVAVGNVDAVKLKEFYRSIPDYNDINHLPSDEFYSTLKSLRDKKKAMLGLANEFIDDCNGHSDKVSENLLDKKDDVGRLPTTLNKSNKTRGTLSIRDKENRTKKNESSNSSETSKNLNKSFSGTCLKRPIRKTVTRKEKIEKGNDNIDLKIAPIKSNLEKSRTEHPKRNHSACSISWNDAKIETEMDQKFDSFFDGRKYNNAKCKTDFDDGDDFKTRSMPASPLRIKRAGSPMRRRKSITIPKPFKMTERDEDGRMVNELHCLQKSFSDNMLHQKCERKRFRTKPVPIESRIPLYDKILQDQAMRFTLHTKTFPTCNYKDKQ